MSGFFFFGGGGHYLDLPSHRNILHTERERNVFALEDERSPIANTGLESYLAVCFSRWASF